MKMMEMKLISVIRILNYLTITHFFLVLVLNRRLKSRYSSFVWMRFVEETTKDIVYKMSLTMAGQESLTKWARRPEVWISLSLRVY